MSLLPTRINMKNSPDLKALIRGCNKWPGYLVLADYLEERGFWRISQELRGISVGPECFAEIEEDGYGDGYGYGKSYGDGYSDGYNYGDGYGDGYGYSIFFCGGGFSGNGWGDGYD